MTGAVTLLAILADPARLSVRRLLRGGREHGVCEMVTRLGGTQSRISRHIATLRAARLVTDRFRSGGMTGSVGDTHENQRLEMLQ
jgi:ArsR family transcriptional regulator